MEDARAGGGARPGRGADEAGAPLGTGGERGASGEGDGEASPAAYAPAAGAAAGRCSVLGGDVPLGWAGAGGHRHHRPDDDGDEDT